MNTQARTSQTLRGGHGSALVVVMVLAGFTLIMLAAYLSRSMTQRRTNLSDIYYAEARTAAEGVAEHAVAEIDRRATAFSSLQTNPLSGFTLSTASKNMIAPRDGLTGAKTDSLSNTVDSALEFKCSDMSDLPSAPLLLDMLDPVYDKTNDPSAGMAVSVRSVNVYARAAVTDNLGRTKNAYVAEHIQIREESWLNYAVFYNMDMEFHAGPNFTITGPVHTNANAYVVEGAGNTLQFESSFSARGKIYRQLKYTGTNTWSSTTFSGTVKFLKTAGSPPVFATMGTNEDSLKSGWYEFAKARWDYKVKDDAFGVKVFAPDGMPTYTPEDFAVSGVQLRNNAWLLVEPQLSNDSTDFMYGRKRVTDTSGTVDPNAPENIKFSALAGWTIEVKEVASATDEPKWVLKIPTTTVADSPVNKENLPVRGTDGRPTYTIIDPWLTDEEDTAVSANQHISRVLKNQLRKAIRYVRYGEGTSFGNGTGALAAFQAQIPRVGGGLSTTGTKDTLANEYAIYDRRQGHIYGSSSNNGLMGAYHLLVLDMGLIDTLINSTTTGLWTRGKDSYDASPSKRWSGVLYVQLPTRAQQSYRFDTTATPTADFIRPAIAPTTTTPGYAVAVKNATVLPRLPRDLSKRGDGFTLATNGPLYIVGHYNADGNSATGSSTTPDAVAMVPTGTSELPALVAADAVTILSSGWDNSDFAASTTTKPSASSFTEVSTAVITGLVPTKPGVDNIWSAGVHNLVRYLEGWGSSTYRYRGSLAAIYESEVAIAPYHENQHGWYDPPTRDMGYHQYLAQGWFPPGTPVKRTVRRMDLRDITEAQWTAGPAKPPVSN